MNQSRNFSLTVKRRNFLVTRILMGIGERFSKP